MSILRVTLFVLLSVFSAEFAAPKFDWTYKDQPWTFENATCIGDGQSPIALSSSTAVKDEDKAKIHFNWEAEDSMETTLMPTKHNLYLTSWEFTQNIVMKEQRYEVHMLDFHWGSDASKGSEHSVDGKVYSGELKISYIKDGDSFFNVADDTFIVVSVLLEEDPDLTEDIKEWKSLIDNIPKVQANPQKYFLQTYDDTSFNLSSLIPPDRKFFRYTGSETTPGCFKPMERIVFKTPMKVSPKFFTALRTFNFPDGTTMQDNFRHIQVQGNRTVYKSFD